MAGATSDDRIGAGRDMLRRPCGANAFCNCAPPPSSSQVARVLFSRRFSVRSVLLCLWRYSSCSVKSDGITGEHGLGLIWSSQRIRDDNLRFRSSAHCRELYDAIRSALVLRR
jgi:hypothetical protein